jgi:hypothetical protein
MTARLNVVKAEKKALRPELLARGLSRSVSITIIACKHDSMQGSNVCERSINVAAAASSMLRSGTTEAAAASGRQQGLLLAHIALNPTHNSPCDVIF